MSSPDLHSWSAPTDPLPTLPSWASTGRTWAPAVIQVGGKYVMYYTVLDTALGMQCLSVATSAAPGAAFSDTSSAPLACQTADGGSIDPNPYLDPTSGQIYLLWKSDDNAIGKNSHIWGEQLSPDGLHFASGTSPSLLLTESAAWQSPTVEGPAVIRNGSTYYLFYGANSYNTASSGIGFATSRSLLGAYRNQSRVGPWLAMTGNAEGPQGPMLFRDASGRTRMAFAAWNGRSGIRTGGPERFGLERSRSAGSLARRPSAEARPPGRPERSRHRRSALCRPRTDEIRGIVLGAGNQVPTVARPHQQVPRAGSAETELHPGAGDGEPVAPRPGRPDN